MLHHKPTHKPTPGGRGRLFPAIALLVMLFAPLFSAPGTSANDLCIDENGVWLVPDGMVIGGPNDTTQQELHATWLALCQFIAEDIEIEIETPFTEVFDSWAQCVATEYRIAGGMVIETYLDDPEEISVQAPNPKDTEIPPREIDPDEALPDFEPVQIEIPGDSFDPLFMEECGEAPDPSIADPDGMVRELLPAIHIGSKDGSITFSTWSYASKSWSSKKGGLINTVFYNNGDANTVKSKLMNNGHWKDTLAHHKYSYCSGDKYAYIDDSMHRGTARWWYQGPITEAHHGKYCQDSRQHIRHYGSNLYDNHYRNFGRYSIGNVHYDHEHWDGHHGHGDTGHLFSERSAFSTSYFQYTSSNSGKPITFYRVP